MEAAAVWLHDGGSGRFASMLVNTDPCESKEAIVQQLRRIPRLDTRPAVPDASLFRIETARPVVVTQCFVAGGGIVDIVRDDDGADEPGRGCAAVPAACRTCGRPATDCFFAPCGHAIYCIECWRRTDPKPARCELCSIPIESAVAPIDASHDDKGTCGICLCEKADAIVLPCGHLICAECGIAWFEDHGGCPYCREDAARCRQFVSYA
jgi:hypothetical protein